MATYWCLQAITLRESETKTRIVKIARYDATPVRFVAADPQSKHLRVEEVQRGDEAGSVVQLTLSLDSSLLNAGDFRSSVIVLAENSAYKQVSVPSATESLPTYPRRPDHNIV